MMARLRENVIGFGAFAMGAPDSGGFFLLVYIASQQ
jgi:hypothetical protein